jgi:hypothetical protein
MMYTRERLLKAVREAGASGQPFTLGEVRAKLGIKSQDKREQKRFRSRFRECSQILGDSLEKLGPNTFRLRAVPGVLPSVAAPAQVRALKAVPTARTSPTPTARGVSAKKQAAADTAPLLDRVGVQRGQADSPVDPEDLYGSKRRAREAISYEAAAPGSGQARSRSFGERLSSWFGRTRTQDSTAAATALSRLAVELQPKAGNFEYRWINGKLQVQRAADK